jgi:hypothetical protein
MLTPIGTPLPQDLQNHDTVQGLPLEHDLTCRTILAILLPFRPDSSAPKAKRDAFKMICDGVPVWLKDEMAEMRRSRPSSTKTTPKAKVRQRKSMRLLTLGPDNERLWVQLYVFPVGDQWHSAIVADGVTPPGPDAVKGIGLYADTPENCSLLVCHPHCRST